MTETFPLKGEIVTLTTWHPVTRGRFEEFIGYYKFTDEHGKTHSGMVKFDAATAKVFRAVGHDVQHSLTHKSYSVHIDVILGVKSTGKGERYCIDHIEAVDGTWHAVESRTALPPKRQTTFSKEEIAAHKALREKQAQRSIAAWNERMHGDKPNTQHEAPAHKAYPTADSPIFAHGERMIKEWLATYQRTA